MEAASRHGWERTVRAPLRRALLHGASIALAALGMLACAEREARA